MATFFGEVVENSSRAFWDGYEDTDDETDADKESLYHLENIEKSENELYDLMIFSTDKISSEFSSLCLFPDKSKIIARILEKGKGLNQSGRYQKSVAELQKINDKILLLTCSADIPLLNANELLLLVIPWLNNSKKVVILTTNPIADYKSFNPDRIPQSSFVRSLKTTTYEEADNLCPSLESPNALTGFPAAVFSWCQVKDQPCVLYVYYWTSSLPVNSNIDIETFYRLFEKFPWYKHYQSDKKHINSIKSIKIHNHVFENSNLYL